MKKKETGKKGELLARRYLESRGMVLRASNWRHGRCEIDLIFQQEELLIFVEVKTRSSRAFGSPGAFLSILQEQRIARAAANYCEIHNHQWEIRYDLVEVLLLPNHAPAIKYFPDAFFPGDEGW